MEPNDRFIKAVSIREGMSESFYIAGQREFEGLYKGMLVSNIEVFSTFDTQFLKICVINEETGGIYEIMHPARFITQMDVITSNDEEAWDLLLAKLNNRRDEPASKQS
jgi:hypothetical protein